jgi:hypothetical protein
VWARRCDYCGGCVPYGESRPHSSFGVHLILSQVRYTGFRAIKAGLQADTYIEAMSVQKQKLGYEDVLSRGVEGSMASEHEVQFTPQFSSHWHHTNP